MIFASNNKGKLNEIKSIFPEEEILSLKEAQIDIDVEENQDSFYGNALKKAKEIYELAKIPVIADDSGLCINAFDGWPGVLTHRFAGEEALMKKEMKY
jgi:XTP/dITP diphosphohydrolase